MSARAVVIATGARYRKLDVPDLARFEGQGIHYAATAMESHLCTGEEVIVVGGGNSAGQAAVFLSRSVARVHLHTRTEITALAGDTFLREVTWVHRPTGEATTRTIGNIFVMIGAEPNTEWLNGCLELDSKGFVKTGQDAQGMALASPYATTKPGIYAVGDVRSGSVKRVASSVGEGSVVVQAIHGFLHPGVV